MSKNHTHSESSYLSSCKGFCNLTTVQYKVSKFLLIDLKMQTVQYTTDKSYPSSAGHSYRQSVIFSKGLFVLKNYTSVSVNGWIVIILNH